MGEQTTNLTEILATDFGVSTEYRHAPKHVTVGETLTLPQAILKWYAVHPREQPIAEKVTRLARAYLTNEPPEARGLGFVVLHRCGNDFYFLIVCTWRNSNELWQTVFYKDGDSMADFAPFPREGAHKPTLCVWELVPVIHEQQTWVRFLGSTRDENAAQAWLVDRYTGPA
jgi:hypothetical protein